MKTIITIMISALYALSLNAQSCAALSIQNLHKEAGDLYFDIYINASDPESKFNLGTFDLVLEFEAGLFDNPTFSMVENPAKKIQGGYCNFQVSNAKAGMDNAILQSNVYSKLDAQLLGDKLIVSYNIPPFDANIRQEYIAPEINGMPNKNRLGRFKLSNLKGVSPCEVALDFKIDETEWTTRISQHNDADLAARPIQVCGKSSPCAKISSIEETQVQDIQAAVTPNPNNGSFTLQLDLGKEQHADIRLYDLRGREVAKIAEGLTSTLNQQIDLTKEAAGVYLLSIKTANEVKTIKIVSLR